MTSCLACLKMSRLLAVVWPGLPPLVWPSPPAASQLPALRSFLSLRCPSLTCYLLGTFTLRLLHPGVLFLPSFIWLTASYNSDPNIIVTSEEILSSSPAYRSLLVYFSALCLLSASVSLLFIHLPFICILLVEVLGKQRPRSCSQPWYQGLEVCARGTAGTQHSLNE